MFLPSRTHFRVVIHIARSLNFFRTLKNVLCLPEASSDCPAVNLTLPLLSHQPEPFVCFSFPKVTLCASYLLSLFYAYPISPCRQGFCPLYWLHIPSVENRTWYLINTQQVFTEDRQMSNMIQSEEKWGISERGKASMRRWHFSRNLSEGRNDTRGVGDNLSKGWFRDCGQREKQQGEVRDTARRWWEARWHRSL